MSRPPLPSFDAIHRGDDLLQQEVLLNFDEHLRNLPPVTLSLVALCALAHAATGWMDIAAGRAGAWGWVLVRSKETMIAAGGREPQAVFDGEVWRLMSCVFLHWDMVHLSLNMLALFGLGRLCEATWGPARFLTLFLGAGLCGSLLSQFGPAEVSAGASGGVFGLLGAGVVFGVRHRSAMAPPLRRVFGVGLVPWVALNLGIGVVLPMIDNLGHLGGLIGGAALAAVLGDRIVPWSARRPNAGEALALGSAVLMAGTLWRVVQSLLEG